MSMAHWTMHVSVRVRLAGADIELAVSRGFIGGQDVEVGGVAEVSAARVPRHQSYVGGELDLGNRRQGPRQRTLRARFERIRTSAGGEQYEDKRESSAHAVLYSRPALGIQLSRAALIFVELGIGELEPSGSPGSACFRRRWQSPFTSAPLGRG